LEINSKECLCRKGYGGDRCEKVLGSQCDISCGEKGDCIDGECVCNENWDGDVRCEKCSNDNACEFGNCIDGICICNEGYGGKECNVKEHKCIGSDCGEGNCIDGICYCPLCIGNTCNKCLTKDCFDCSLSFSLVLSWKLYSIYFLIQYMIIRY